MRWTARRGGEIVPLICTLALLAGCNSYSDARFVRKISNDHFAYVAFADWVSPPDNSWSESTRLLALDKFMKDNRYCPRGYNVVSRKVDASPGKGADVYLINYDIMCKIDLEEIERALKTP